VPDGRRDHHARTVVGPRDVLDADLVVDVERLLPRLAAVGAAIQPALFRVRVDVALRGDEDEVRIVRINKDGGDLLRLVEPQVLPGLAGVHRLVDAVPFVDPAAGNQVPHADVDDVGVRLGHRDVVDAAAHTGGADRPEAETPEQRILGLVNDGLGRRGGLP